MTTYGTQVEETESEREKHCPASLRGNWIGVWVFLTMTLVLVII